MPAEWERETENSNQRKLSSNIRRLNFSRYFKTIEFVLKYPIHILTDRSTVPSLSPARATNILISSDEIPRFCEVGWPFKNNVDNSDGFAINDCLVFS